MRIYPPRSIPSARLGSLCYREQFPQAVLHGSVYVLILGGSGASVKGFKLAVTGLWAEGLLHQVPRLLCMGWGWEG